MTSTPTELGALLDSWFASGQIGLVETAPAVTVSRLDAASTELLLTVVRQLDWNCDVQDASGEPVLNDSFEEEFGPFLATIQKEVNGEDRHLLTRAGLIQALSEKIEGVWQIACSKIPFATGTISFNPWGGGDIFLPASPTKSPLDIVRESNEVRLVPVDIRKWLVRGEISEELWQDSAFKTFSAVSAPALVRSLSSEINGLNTVVFSGPPRLSIALSDNDLIKDLALEGYRNLRMAVTWVYEDSPSVEQRHALFAAEFARSATRDETIGMTFRAAGNDILESSRLAFQLSLSNLSREAIKAQGDLRKAIADDMSKAAEGTRALSGAIAAAIATGITLVAARSTGAAEPWILSVVAIVVAGYLVIVAGSGWAYLKLQRELRDQWRQRFYRFVPSADYEAMVSKPMRSAERPYHFVAAIALVIAAALLWIAVSIWTAK